MKNDQINNLISSTLKTIACDNLVSEYELTQARDKSLQDILNEQIKNGQNQSENQNEKDHQ